MSLFSRRPQKVALVLSPDERAIRALMTWRNKLLKQGKPTEDVNVILLKLMA